MVALVISCDSIEHYCILPWWEPMQTAIFQFYIWDFWNAKYVFKGGCHLEEVWNPGRFNEVMFNLEKADCE